MRGARMLHRGRKRSLERMDSECVITRPGTKVWDEEAGEWVPQIETVYEGVCRLVDASTGGRRVESGSQLLVVTSPELHLPFDTVGVSVSDSVVITACLSRPAVIGEQYVIREPVDGTQVTALRFRVVAADGR